MKYKCCKYIKNGICFQTAGVRFCSKLSSVVTNDFIPYNENFFEKFMAYKQQIINECQNGNAPDYCKNCIYFEEREWNDTKIKYIDLFHWNQCNCACVYCSNRNETKLQITTKKVKGSIELYKILKFLLKDNLLDEKVDISFGGGEPTILKEFLDILKLFMKQKYNMHLLTNAILYEKMFSKFLKQSTNNYMTISLDCGTAETFRRIKGVDKFNDVIKNIKRYIKESGENSKNLFIKYILIEGLNDNKEEIIKWIELCKSLGVKSLHPSIEFCHSFKDQNKKGPSDNICDLYNYMKEIIVENGFNMNTYDFLEPIIKNRSYR